LTPNIRRPARFSRAQQVAKDITVDATLPFDPMALEEDRPLIWLVIATLYMALGLLIPAVFEAVRHGCLIAWTDLTVNGLAQFREGELPGEPSARFGTDGASPSPARDESVNRGVHG
jgi:hypothetical protein